MTMKSSITIQYSPIFFLKNFEILYMESIYYWFDTPQNLKKSMCEPSFMRFRFFEKSFTISCVFVSDFTMVSLCLLIWFVDGMMWGHEVVSALPFIFLALILNDVMWCNSHAIPSDDVMWCRSSIATP